MEGETTKRPTAEAPVEEKSSNEEGASKEQIDLGLTGATDGEIEIEVAADSGPAVVEGDGEKKCDPKKEKCKPMKCDVGMKCADIPSIITDTIEPPPESKPVDPESR